MFRLDLAKNSLWVMILLLVIGPFMLVWGSIGFISHKQITDKCTAVTYGVVVNVKEETVRRHRHYETTYTATVEPQDSSIFNVSSLTSGKSGYSYDKGQTVKINYDPSDSSAYFIEHAEPTSGDINLIIAGAAVLFIGLVVLVGRKIMKV